MVNEIRMNLNRVVMFLFAVLVISGVIGNLNIANPIYSNALAQSANPNIDPQAAEILQNMSYVLGSKDEYTFKAEVIFDQLVNSNRKIQYSAV